MYFCLLRSPLHKKMLLVYFEDTFKRVSKILPSAALEPYSNWAIPERKKKTLASKIQTFLFSHSEFSGKICEIASGIPDFLHGGRAQFIWNSPLLFRFTCTANWCVSLFCFKTPHFNKFILQLHLCYAITKIIQKFGDNTIV